MIQLKEIYKQIPEFPDYEVSTVGNVRKIKNGKVLKRHEKSSYGGLRCALALDGKTFIRQVSGLVANVHVPNPNEYKHYIFRDYNSANPTAINIVWVPSDVYSTYLFRGRKGTKKHFDTRENQIKKLRRNIETAKMMLEFLEENDIVKINAIVLNFEDEIKKAIRKYTSIIDVQNECFQHTVFTFMDNCNRNIMQSTNFAWYCEKLFQNSKRNEEKEYRI
jgi:hypothetical protein